MQKDYDNLKNILQSIPDVRMDKVTSAKTNVEKISNEEFVDFILMSYYEIKSIAI